MANALALTRVLTSQRNVSCSAAGTGLGTSTPTARAAAADCACACALLRRRDASSCCSLPWPAGVSVLLSAERWPSARANGAFGRRTWTRHNAVSTDHAGLAGSPLLASLAVSAPTQGASILVAAAPAVLLRPPAGQSAPGELLPPGDASSSLGSRLAGGKSEELAADGDGRPRLAAAWRHSRRSSCCSGAGAADVELSGPARGRDASAKGGAETPGSAAAAGAHANGCGSGTPGTSRSRGSSSSDGSNGAALPQALNGHASHGHERAIRYTAGANGFAGHGHAPSPESLPVAPSTAALERQLPPSAAAVLAAERSPAAVRQGEGPDSRAPVAAGRSSSPLPPLPQEQLQQQQQQQQQQQAPTGAAYARGVPSVLTRPVLPSPVQQAVGRGQPGVRARSGAVSPPPSPQRDRTRASPRSGAAASALDTPTHTARRTARSDWGAEPRPSSGRAHVQGHVRSSGPPTAPARRVAREAHGDAADDRGEDLDELAARSGGEPSTSYGGGPQGQRSLLAPGWANARRRLVQLFPEPRPPRRKRRATGARGPAAAAAVVQVAVPGSGKPSSAAPVQRAHANGWQLGQQVPSSAGTEAATAAAALDAPAAARAASAPASAASVMAPWPPARSSEPYSFPFTVSRTSDTPIGVGASSLAPLPSRSARQQDGRGAARGSVGALAAEPGTPAAAVPVQPGLLGQGPSAPAAGPGAVLGVADSWHWGDQALNAEHVCASSGAGAAAAVVPSMPSLQYPEQHPQQQQQQQTTCQPYSLVATPQYVLYIPPAAAAAAAATASDAAGGVAAQRQQGQRHRQPPPLHVVYRVLGSSGAWQCRPLVQVTGAEPPLLAVAIPAVASPAPAPARAGPAEGGDGPEASSPQAQALEVYLTASPPARHGRTTQPSAASSQAGTAAAAPTPVAAVHQGFALNGRASGARGCTLAVPAAEATAAVSFAAVRAAGWNGASAAQAVAAEARAAAAPACLTLTRPAHYLLSLVPQHPQQQQQQQDDDDDGEDLSAQPVAQSQHAQQQAQQQRPPSPPLAAHAFLRREVALVLDTSSLAGGRGRTWDAQSLQLRRVWEATQRVRPGLLVVATSRTMKSLEQLWRDKQAFLPQPDVLLLGLGTTIAYRLPGDPAPRDTDAGAAKRGAGRDARAASAASASAGGQGGWVEDDEWAAELERSYDAAAVRRAVAAVVQRYSHVRVAPPSPPCVASQQPRAPEGAAAASKRADARSAAAASSSAAAPCTTASGSKQACGSRLAVTYGLDKLQDRHRVCLEVHRPLAAQFVRDVRAELAAAAAASATAAAPGAAQRGAGPADRGGGAAAAAAAARDAVEAAQFVVQPRGPRGEWCSVDVIPAAAGKAAALRHVLRRFGISPTSVVATGDTDRDADMLAAAGAAIVTATRAPPRLRELLQQSERWAAHEAQAAARGQGARQAPAGPRVVQAARWSAAGVIEGLQMLGLL